MNVRILLPLLATALLLAAPARAEGDDAAALYAAGLKAEEAKDFKAAVEAYGKVLDLDENYDDAFERWEYCGKLAEWQDGLAGEPTAADLVRLGEVWLDCGNVEKEREAYEEALAKDPSCAEAHGHLALSHYAGGNGSLEVVIRETVKFLEVSPQKEHLKRALDDFNVFGKLRILKAVIGKDLEAAAAARKGGDLAKAADVLKAAAAQEVPDAYRTLLLTEAGKLLLGAGDDAGARASFTSALSHAACASTIDARLGLAALDVKAGALPAALEHLQAAVKEGSKACADIAEQKEKAFAPLFAAEDAAIREAAAALTSPEKADEPIREEIRKAVEKANAEKKAVLLYWYGPYCPYVMAMEERLARPEIREMLAKKFVVVRIDYGSHHRAMTVDAEYGDVFKAFGVPSFMVLNSEGRIHEIARDTELMGAPHRCYDPEKILEFLTRVAPAE